MKKLGLLLILAALFATESNARCLRKKRMHEHKHVVRCEYNQDDIYRAYAQNPGRYGCIERYKRCIYCGCKIEEHSKKEDK